MQICTEGAGVPRTRHESGWPEDESPTSGCSSQLPRTTDGTGDSEVPRTLVIPPEVCPELRQDSLSIAQADLQECPLCVGQLNAVKHLKSSSRS